MIRSLRSWLKRGFFGEANAFFSDLGGGKRKAAQSARRLDLETLETAHCAGLDRVDGGHRDA